MRTGTEPKQALDTGELKPHAQAVLFDVNRLGDEYALRGFARELTRQRMTLSIRLHGCHPTGLLAWLAPGLRGSGCTLTNGQIATALGKSEHTIRKHLAALEATGEIQRHGSTNRRRLTFGVAEGLHSPPVGVDNSPSEPNYDRETVTPRPSDGRNYDRETVTTQEKERSKRHDGSLTASGEPSCSCRKPLGRGSHAPWCEAAS